MGPLPLISTTPRDKRVKEAEEQEQEEEEGSRGCGDEGCRRCAKSPETQIAASSGRNSQESALARVAPKLSHATRIGVFD